MDKQMYEALLNMSVNQFNSKAAAVSTKGRIVSEETKIKMSLAQKGKKASVETRAKLSIAHKGKKRSEQARLNIIKGLTGRKQSDETKQKISLAKKGKVTAKEVIAKLRLASTGKKHSVDTKLKCRLNNAMNRKVLTPSGQYRSVTATAEAYGKHIDTIRNWIKKGDKGFSYLD